MVRQVEVPSSPVAVEMDADLLGVSTGRMFHRAVNRMGGAPTKQAMPQQSKPKPQKSPQVVKKAAQEPRPRREDTGEAAEQRWLQRQNHHQR